MLKSLIHEKRVGESYPLQVDFSNRLTGTLESAVVSSGSVMAETGITIGSVSSTSTTVQFGLSGGAAGESYSILVQAELSTGAIVQELVVVEVI